MPVTPHFPGWQASIEIVTISRSRPNLLARAVESVCKQCCVDAVVVHSVYIDDDRATFHRLRSQGHTGLRVEYVDREDACLPHGAARVSELRSRFATAGVSRLVCFLDDDNWWLPDHLHSLIETLERTGAPAVHSWCRVMDESGEPFDGGYDPWQSGWDEARESYLGLIASGVTQADSNIFRDRADPCGSYPGALSVDAGEWLLRREILDSVGYPSKLLVSPDGAVLGDDDAFLRRLVDANVPIAATGSATLCYQLGGFSTSRMRDGKLRWHCT